MKRYPICEKKSLQLLSSERQQYLKIWLQKMNSRHWSVLSSTHMQASNWKGEAWEYYVPNWWCSVLRSVFLWVLSKDFIFPPPLNEVKTKERKRNERYKPFGWYGQTCIPFGEFTPVRTCRWRSDSGSCWGMKMCAAVRLETPFNIKNL